MKPFPNFGKCLCLSVLDCGRNSGHPFKVLAITERISRLEVTSSSSSMFVVLLTSIQAISAATRRFVVETQDACKLTPAAVALSEGLLVMSVSVRVVARKPLTVLAL